MDKSKSLNDYITVYKEILEQGDIQIAYESLRKYVMTLKAQFSKKLSDKYSLGNVSPGYMDFTYFPFFDSFLRSRKLRFGIVLNHKDVRFELWLMGQNAEDQRNYWELLKDAKWNKGRSVMPRYSVLEVVLVEAPDFNDLDTLSAEIINRGISVTEEIQDFIKRIE
ncbi:DUF7000 family protein [Lacrimispora sp.]|jgi:hypothetical protein|uniref:DUF7000 family protein n=1 Tax=Lacrimispora sp. TaxID=2719234 RepID=UPI0028A2A8A9|nr:hypothetical protein [Lacrimispora sp.]